MTSMTWSKQKHSPVKSPLLFLLLLLLFQSKNQHGPIKIAFYPIHMCVCLCLCVLILMRLIRDIHFVDGNFISRSFVVFFFFNFLIHKKVKSCLRTSQEMKPNKHNKMHSQQIPTNMFQNSSISLETLQAIYMLHTFNYRRLNKIELFCFYEFPTERQWKRFEDCVYTKKYFTLEKSIYNFVLGGIVKRDCWKITKKKSIWVKLLRNFEQSIDSKALSKRLKFINWCLGRCGLENYLNYIKW